MTDPGRLNGDNDIAAPTGSAGLVHQDSDDAATTPAAVDDDEVVRTRNRPRPSNLMLLVGAILVATIANVVVAWLVLGSTTQVRDQYTIANGLQRCLIRAQLSENSTTDPNGAAYKTAVLACINR